MSVPGAGRGRAVVDVVALWTPVDASRSEQRSVAEDHVTARAGVPTRLCRHCGSDRHGQPRVRGAFVSLAYAPGLVVVALADAAVGVDVELDGPELPGFADTMAWTRAEAVLKATGEGLRRHPSTIDATAAWTCSLPLESPYVGTLALLGVDSATLSWSAAPGAPARTATGPATP